MIENLKTVDEIKQRLAAYRPQLMPEREGKRASVLVPLYVQQGEVHVVFTKRTDRVETHKGEISFPGGAREAFDTDLVHTAMRECDEEIGLRPEHIDIIGQLDDITTVSNFHVSVYVGRLHSHPHPYLWLPQESEVAEVLEVPLRHLRDERNLVEVPRERDGILTLLEGWVWQEHIIWGATGRMLRNFLDVTEG